MSREATGCRVDFRLHSQNFTCQASSTKANQIFLIAFPSAGKSMWCQMPGTSPLSLVRRRFGKLHKRKYKRSLHQQDILRDQQCLCVKQHRLEQADRRRSIWTTPQDALEESKPKWPSL